MAQLQVFGKSVAEGALSEDRTSHFFICPTVCLDMKINFLAKLVGKEVHFLKTSKRIPAE